MEQLHGKATGPMGAGSTNFAAAYEEALRDYGIDVKALAAARAAEHIRETSIATEVAIALDDWARSLQASSDASAAAWKKLVDVAREADTDARRARIRQATVADDLEDLKTLAREILDSQPSSDSGKEDAPATESLSSDWPAPTLNLLAASLPDGDRQTALALYRKAHQLHPGDFWVHHHLAILLSTGATTETGVIRPGEPLLEIVPEDAMLIIDARVRPTDIDRVRPGMEARVLLTAYKQRNLPRINGVLRSISADRLVDDRTGEAYFLAKVDVNPEDLALLDEVHLAPGMPADVMILNDEQTLIDYLLGPILQSMRRSFHEN